MSSSPPAAPLRASTLGDLPDGIGRPSYDRAALAPGIVHIGVGGFHRAHLATYADELAALGDMRWGIVGVGVLASDAEMARALGSQDHLYTLVTRGTERTRVDVVGSIIDFLHAHPDPSDLIDRLAAETTEIVSLTVTEGGYPVDDQTGDYRSDSHAAGPDSAFGLIARGLEARRHADGGPVTILSCDNIIANGSAAKAALLGEAARIGEPLVTWITRNATFPNSMVDRITPATTDADRAALARDVGIDDAWPVATEPFRQWVVEDAFAGARPRFELLDVIVTDDVEPYELMKLRLLNAAHSCLAYLASLAGIERVDDAMADPEIRHFVRMFLTREALPVLPPIPDFDLEAYIESLIERFSNPAIGDQISRLCLDGSAKFPKFLLPTVRAQLAVGGPIERSAMALAGWCQYLLGPPDQSPLAADSLLDVATAHAKASTDDPVAFLEFSEVFDRDLADSAVFRDAFTGALGRLRTHGVRSALEMMAPRPAPGEDGAGE